MRIGQNDLPGRIKVQFPAVDSGLTGYVTRYHGSPCFTIDLGLRTKAQWRTRFGNLVAEFHFNGTISSQKTCFKKVTPAYTLNSLHQGTLPHEGSQREPRPSPKKAAMPGLRLHEEPQQ